MSRPYHQAQRRDLIVVLVVGSYLSKRSNTYRSSDRLSPAQSFTYIGTPVTKILRANVCHGVAARKRCTIVQIRYHACSWLTVFSTAHPVAPSTTSLTMSTRKTASWNGHLNTRPRSPVAAILWRGRIWVETTFAMSMMEPWEKLLIRMYPIAPSRLLNETRSHSYVVLFLLAMYTCRFLTGIGEKIQPKTVIICVVTTTFCMAAIVSYLPHHISLMHQRALFYLSGQESVVSGKEEVWSAVTTRGEL